MKRLLILLALLVPFGAQAQAIDADYGDTWTINVPERPDPIVRVDTFTVVVQGSGTDRCFREDYVLETSGSWFRQTTIPVWLGTFTGVPCAVAPEDPSEPPEDPPTDPPAGGAFFQDDFDSGSYHPANGFLWTDSNHQSSDGLDPVASGGRSGGALRFRFGASGSNGDGWSEQRYDMGRNLSEVWVEYWVLIPSNYDHRSGSPSNNKWFWLWDSGNYPGGATGQPWFSLNADAAGGGSSRMYILWGGPGQGERRTDPVANINPRDYRGQWVRIRIHATHSLVEMWWQDTRFINANVSLGSVPFRRGYFFGWWNSGVSQTQDFLVDDVRFYDVNPGW